MEWLFERFHRHPPAPAPVKQAEAERELRRAQAALQKSKREAEEARRVAKSLGEINDKNHFAERAILALKGIVHE